MATYLFNNFYNKSQPLTSIINCIINHPLFEQKVIEFRNLFPELQLLPSHFTQLSQMYFTFILPDYPQYQHKRLALELYQSLQLQLDKVKLTYGSLAELLGKICLMSIQNIDLRNSIGFLSLLMDRIADYYTVNVITGEKTKISYHFKLELFDSQSVIHDSEMTENHHRNMVKDVHFQEKVCYEEDYFNNNQKTVIIRRLKESASSIVPYGYVCEDFLSQLINSDFQTRNSYRLGSCRKVALQKTQYWITPNESVSNAIRDQIINQEIFYTTGILSTSHLPLNPIPNSKLTYSIARTNRAFSRQNYYQKLKDTRDQKVKYFNILSEFFQRDEFSIDEITLTRQKLIARRKELLLGIQPRDTVKKDAAKDYQLQATLLPQKIYDNLINFWDHKKMEQNLKQLTTILKPKLQEAKQINSFLQSNLSQYSSLPTDPADPFIQDILTYSSKQPLQLLIIGRPKSGKSTLAKAIAKKYKISYISIETAIQKVFERLKFFQQNPPQADEDGNIIGGLNPIQKCIIEDLTLGKSVDEEDILDLINSQFQKDYTQSCGFILDLPFEYKKYWVQAIINNKIIFPKINCRFFTHIIQVEQTDQQWKYFSEAIMQKPEDLNITSALDRYILGKPKPVSEQGEQEEQQEIDEQKPQPVKEENLINLKWKEGVYSLIQNLTQHIHPHRYIKVQNSYQSVEQCIKLISNNLYAIPFPKRIQGNQKQLLTVGYDESKLVRKWSPWGIIDPVELKKEKLINGKFQFAAEYAGRVFVFDNQNNLNAFLNNHRKFLDKLPQLPNKTNICIVGPRKSGKKTLAKRLSEIYKLRVIDFKDILEKVIIKQKSLQSHVPSNPEKRSKTVHLSETQFKQFSKGNLLNAKDVLPIILYQLGITLQKKPVGWGIEKQQGGQGQQQEQKKAPPIKKKKKEKNQEQQRPKTPPIEDLSLKQIIPQINHLGKLNEIRGYILINFPTTEDQLNSLKSFNIPIDKMIILNDNNEEAPNKQLGNRLNDAQLQQLGLFFTSLQPVKETLGQEVCKQISIDKTPQEILNKVRQIIDPFYLKADDDSINRVLADKQEDNDPVPMGFCGDYCPVVLKQKWLIKGKEQFESGVKGKRFRFCGQKQLLKFKQNPQQYLNVQKRVIPPRIMFMGLRGVGLTTQLLKLTNNYKIPILNLKETLLQYLQGEKNKRKTERYYKRGFKKPEYDEEGKLLEDEELNAESPQFDKRAHEIEVTRKIFQDIDQIFINGNFFEVDEEKISTNIVELLTQARRLPQVVYVLKADENKWLARNLDKNQIQKELDDQIQKTKTQKKQQLQKQRQAAQEAGEEWNSPPEQEENFPKLEEKIAQKTEFLKARRQADISALQGFVEAFRGLNIEVVEINCERQIKHVTEKINYSLKRYIEDRVQRWEKYNMLTIQRERVQDFLNNFIVKESRFGKLNPLTLVENLRPAPLIYNDRIYYLKDEEERQQIIKNPALIQTNRSIPKDVKTITGVFVIGKAKTGRTTLAKTIASKLGLVYVSFTQILSEFTQEHQDFDILQIINEFKQGKLLFDDQIVTLLIKRLKLWDCQTQGWVIDGLPQTKAQAQLLNRAGIIPIEVFSLSLNEIQIKKRIVKCGIPEYQFDIEVVHQRLSKNKKQLAEVEFYYETRYNNLMRLDANLSKWGLFEASRKVIQKKIKSKRQFIRSLALFEAANMSAVDININCIINNLSDYANYCPISFKLKRQYIRKCLKSHDNLVLYNKKLYIFNTQKQLQDFILNPETFVTRGPSFQPPIQVEFQDFKKIDEKAQNKAYCLVELLRKNLVKGNYSYALIYKNKIYLTANPKNMKLFIRNPTLYQMVKLPDKLPVEFEKKNELKKIAKRNDCTAFLEHHLSNIMMKSLAQLGYKRPKYPTLSSKESAMKFLAISLKATNPNKEDQYRQKYLQKLQKFIKDCSLSQQIRSEVSRKKKSGQSWQEADQQNLIKLCEEYSEFMKQLQTEDKLKYFQRFIR